MKCRILSDLHIEFRDYEVPALPDDKDTVLVLAGDVAIVSKPSVLNDLLLPFLRRCSEQFRFVVVVLGNHEFYGGSLIRTFEKLTTAIEVSGTTNVRVLEKSSTVIDGVAFIGTTLWTDCGNGNPLAPWLFRQMSDSRLIRTGTCTDPYGLRFTPQVMYEAFIRAKQYILGAIDAHRSQGHKVVLVTHHGVTHQSIADRYKGEELNIFYVSDLSQELIDHPPTLVVHGHVHTALDYHIGNDESYPRVVCNPRGYPGESVEGFNDLLVIEV